LGSILSCCAEGDAYEWAVVNLDQHELFIPMAFGHPNTLSGMLAVDAAECVFGVPGVLPLLLASFAGRRGGGDPRVSTL
jgi:hypothetical protein